MCGLAGILDLRETGRISESALRPMIRALDHRGPDQKGIYLDDRAGLGHARLSLIDIAGGVQPIHNEDRTVWIILNGEIYNFPELRTRLEAGGHRFYTKSDTETIVHLYEDEGLRCLDRLNGQFAFALWDAPRRELVLARDRLGICPLYWTEHDGRVLFASEIKALFASNLVPPAAMDPRAMDQIFTFWAPLPGRTAFENIRELQPGHALTIGPETRRLRRYWDLPYCPPESYLRDGPREIAEGILALLTDATRIRLRADVPVGSYLSGGLDSSGISALIARNFDVRLRTFGVRFQEGSFDEGPAQGEMAGFLGVRHEELAAGNSLIAETFPQVVRQGETPILRTAPVPMFLLSRFVRQQGLKVVCTGEGADEIFGGYDIFREALVRRFVARRPESKSRASLLDHLYPQIFKTGREKASLRSFLLRDVSNPRDPLYSHLIRWTNTSRIKRFFSNDLRAALEGYSAIDELVEGLPGDFSERDLLARAQYLEEIIFLSGYLLSSQGDRMAMAHGVEIRPPYLDHRIVEYMARVPPIWKILGLEEKHILKKALRPLLPASIVARTKHPYRAPIQQAFRGRLDSDDYRAFLSKQSLEDTGLFDPARVDGLRAKLESGASTGEIEGMAIAGIISAQILRSQVLRPVPAPGSAEPAWDAFFDYRAGASSPRAPGRPS